MSQLPGSFHDLNNLGKHFYYDSRRKGENNDAALVIMAVSSIGIGCKILLDVWSRNRDKGGWER